MRFFHLSDLHLGKKVNGFSMIEEQKDILDKIIEFAKEYKPDSVLIAGDVYDKSFPVVDAIDILDKFIVSLNQLNISVFIISGNHDDARRLSFGSELLENSKVYIVRSYNGEVTPITVSDKQGNIKIWMLPYLKPAIVRPYFPEKTISTYTEAVEAVLSEIEINTNERNILIAHQFITGAVTSESEELSVGGSENVDVHLFDNFDYVALGHIHRPQKISRDTVRYSGTPLKYSFSEVKDKKSVTLVEMGEKRDIKISEIPLIPLREMREIRGEYNEIMKRENYIGTNLDDYIHIILTDEQDEPDAITKLRTVYPNIMALDYDNKRTNSDGLFSYTVSTENKTPSELFGKLFEQQNGQKMTAEQLNYVEEMLKKIAEEEKI
jgi:exonuclease SbcD